MFIANKTRYNDMIYRRCGRSGLMLPAISLGMWQNFGDQVPLENSRKMILSAFDMGITMFDLANNYGPSPGSAEMTFGKVLKSDLMPYRDEILVSTKAGYTMWDGHYGDWGSRKYLLASLDQSLKRMGLEYVDIFYHHREDPNTPLEESMTALSDAVKQGKALYVGISNYKPEKARQAAKILRELGTPCIIHQPRYSMFERWIEDGLLDVLEDEGIGSIAFSPLYQGLLTGKYLNGIPDGSRVARKSVSIRPDFITDEKLSKVRKLNDIAAQRGQSLSQLALAWVLRPGHATSALIGASRTEQIVENVGALKNLDFTDDELDAIDKILSE